ncbi:MAG: proline dehydrogenase [Flavobacteriales bacterium]|jgi:proline dehydrogenase|nr:proline dehydrogenase [Flavobacteriales bacterium]
MTHFNNLEVAFSDKSNADLNRAHLLFKTISSPFLSKILTSIVKICLWLKLPITPIIKATVFKHFCGGTTIKNSQKVMAKLWESHIGTILDYSAEGKKSEEDFNHVMEETIRTILKSKNEKSIPFSVFKFTGLCSFSLLEKMSYNSVLTKKEEVEKGLFLSRIETICRTAAENKVPIFIDAEESWIQNAIDNITMEMMRKYNKEEACIYNTLQMYRNDRITYLNELVSDIKDNKYFVGLKLVRGAYHEQEIERAKQKNYPCPVHTIKENTDTDYNKALRICMENIDRISVCAGTHNEESSSLLMDLMQQHNIQKGDKRIFFSQLLGMSDHISYNIANSGFNVAKYVPYGPVKDVLPYLIRRAEENTSIAGQMGRELTNIIEEKKRRRNS